MLVFRYLVLIRPPDSPTLFPSTTLFRSGQIVQGQPPLAATIVILSARVAVCTGVLASVTCTVKLLVPVVVGVPEICPPEDSDNPAGSAPEISDRSEERRVGKSVDLGGARILKITSSRHVVLRVMGD